MTDTNTPPTGTEIEAFNELQKTVSVQLELRKPILDHAIRAAELSASGAPKSEDQRAEYFGGVILDALDIFDGLTGIERLEIARTAASLVGCGETAGVLAARIYGDRTTPTFGPDVQHLRDCIGVLIATGEATRSVSASIRPMMLPYDGLMPKNLRMNGTKPEEAEKVAASQRRLMAEMGADRYREIKRAQTEATATEAAEDEARAKETRRIELERRERLRTS